MGSHLPWHLGSDQSPIVKTTDTHRAYFCLVCGTVRLSEPPFTTMCETCKPDTFPKWTSYRGDFPARTSALQDLELAWQASEAGYFLRSQDWLASYDRDSSSWKTSQLFLIEDSPKFVWPSLRSGTIVDGRLYQPRKLEPISTARGGFSWARPVARDSKGYTARESKTVCNRIKKLYPNSSGKPHPNWLEGLMGYRMGWTELSALGIAWFRLKRGKRLKG